MKFKAKFNAKFYIAFVLLLGCVILGWDGLYFLNANEILTEDNTPMDPTTKLLFSVAVGAIVLSWTVSLMAMIRQLLIGRGFALEKDGICCTLSASMFLAFVFVIPIRKIPYEAIERVCEENGTLTLLINKKKVDTLWIFRPFVSKRYHLFSGFTTETQERIKAELNVYFQG